MTKKYYKAFDKNLQCRGFQYEVGKTYTHEGDISICESGFHSCENPFDVLDYYDLTNSRFCEVSIDGEIKTHAEDSKVVSQIISIDKELNLNEFIAACTDFIDEDTQAVSGNYSNQSASGHSSKQTAAGDFSRQAASGYNSRQAASGGYSKQAASGDFSRQAASGIESSQAASGCDSRQAASGIESSQAASGHSSKQAASEGYSRQAASGDYSRQAASGTYSRQAASGNYSRQAASGCKSIAMIAGADGKIKIGKEGAMALTWWDKEVRPRISVGYEGENGIKADTWYTLDDNGNFIECEEL